MIFKWRAINRALWHTSWRAVSGHAVLSTLLLKGALLVIVAAMAGCDSRDNLFPLRVGNEWSYGVKTGLADYVEAIKVSRQVPVAGVQGYELTSSMGITRIAWKGETLYARVLTGTRFEPPLPILNGAEEKHTYRWEGSIYSAGKAYKGTATIEQDAESLTQSGHKLNTIKSVITVRLPDREIRTESFYAPGTGLVNQVERTTLNGQETARFDVEMDYLSGP